MDICKHCFSSKLAIKWKIHSTSFQTRLLVNSSSNWDHVVSPATTKSLVLSLYRKKGLSIPPNMNLKV